MYFPTHAISDVDKEKFFTVSTYTATRGHPLIMCFKTLEQNQDFKVVMGKIDQEQST